MKSCTNHENSFILFWCIFKAIEFKLILNLKIPTKKSGKFLNFDQGEPGKVRENQFLQVMTTMALITEIMNHF